MDGLSEGSKTALQNRRMTLDWFRTPPTDYLNVSAIQYPRGSKATVAELDENNALVDVLYYRNSNRQFYRSVKSNDEWIVQLFVDTNDIQDATADSTKFAAIGVSNKSLIETLRPALASVHHAIPETNTEEHRFYSPFDDLFFAQGRILETFKHAGLGNVKEKQLRAFVAVMQVVLKKTNHQVREMAGKKVVDFEHLWTLYPPGSFVVTDIREVPHVLQCIDNPAEPILPDPNGRKKEEKHYVMKFASYGYDGYNFGMYEDKWNAWDFKGYVSISSFGYRPLKFEERFGDASIVKRAIERGRKTLAYQSYHHVYHSGKASVAYSKEHIGTVTLEGRVVVDALQARRADPEWTNFFIHNEHDIMPIPNRRKEIYDAMRPLFLTAQGRRPNEQEMEKRRAFFSQHDEYLMLMKPLVCAWSLIQHDWYWVDVTNLQPIHFLENPMERLFDSSTRQMGLLNVMIQRKLQLMHEEDNGTPKSQEEQARPLVIQFSGTSGTGKTATVNAIAELHRRPLIQMIVPRSRIGRFSIPAEDFGRALDNAAAWKAIIHFDDASAVFRVNEQGGYWMTNNPAITISQMVENHNGIVFLAKRDGEKLTHHISHQVQARIHLEPFSAKKRLKIWRALFEKERVRVASEKALVSMETLEQISEWNLNGHEIQHLFQNILLLQPMSGEICVSLSDIEELKKLTCAGSEQSTPSTSRDASKRGRSGKKESYRADEESEVTA